MDKIYDKLPLKEPQEFKLENVEVLLDLDYNLNFGREHGFAIKATVNGREAWFAWLTDEGLGERRSPAVAVGDREQVRQAMERLGRLLLQAAYGEGFEMDTERGVLVLRG
ncbi:MAG: hypothetical protein QME75_16100 [Deltaproteobacteria bacterium]|nr:hypothetical protein [Deltaproteobacteria bacterium]